MTKDIQEFKYNVQEVKYEINKDIIKKTFLLSLYLPIINLLTFNFLDISYSLGMIISIVSSVALIFWHLVTSLLTFTFHGLTINEIDNDDYSQSKSINRNKKIKLFILIQYILLFISVLSYIVFLLNN